MASVSLLFEVTKLESTGQGGGMGMLQAPGCGSKMRLAFLPLGLRLYSVPHSHAPSPTSLPLVLTELLVDTRVGDIAVNEPGLLSELEEPEVRSRV